jgi:lipopolysaccharide biosynthesis glycosyltransferase
MINNKVFSELKVLKHFSRDMYSRYILPDLLEDKDRVLYLDSDTLITGDIAELYNTKLGNNLAAGVRDIGITKDDLQGYAKNLGLDDGQYFNSGVLLLNLDKMRKENVTKKLIEETDRLSDKLQHPDQDIINLVMRDKIGELPNIWNYQDEDRRLDPGILKDSKIIHYTTAIKPWNTPNIIRGYNKEAHELYEKYEYDYLESLHIVEKVSIITPVYNTKKEFIDDYLNSVLTQTYKDIEVILVDDGSQERTAKYLDKIAEKDERIVVIHKKNEGSHRARQTGFEKSTGKLITFVDSDDRIESNCIQKLYMSIVNCGTVMSICESWDEIDFPLEARTSQDSRVIEGRNEIFYYGVVGFPDFRLQSGVVWGKLFDRNLIAAVDWDESDYRITEDEFMMTQVLSMVDRLGVVRDQLYYYRRLVSTSKEFRLPKYNEYNGKPMPIVRTAADLYNKTQKILKNSSLSINEDALVVRYAWMLERYFDGLSHQGGLDKANEDELIRQSRTFMPIVLGSSYLTDEKKLRTIVILGASQAINTYDRFIAAQNSRLDSLQTEVNYLSNQNNRLNLEIGQFLGIKRSARLLLGNIKRRVKSRFFRPHS